MLRKSSGSAVPLERRRSRDRTGLRPFEVLRSIYKTSINLLCGDAGIEPDADPIGLAKSSLERLEGRDFIC